MLTTAWEAWEADEAQPSAGRAVHGCFLAPVWVSWRFVSVWKCHMQNPAPSEVGENKSTHALC